MNKKYKLPSMDFPFEIQITGEESGINWTGKFLYRRPVLAERSLIEQMRARLCGDLRTINAEVSDFNEALAHLRFTLREYPDWWKETDMGGSLYDANVVIEIYNKCIEFEVKWRTKVHGGSADAVEVKDGPSQAASSVISGNAE